MMDLVTVVAVITCAQCVTRLTDALAQRLEASMSRADHLRSCRWPPAPTMSQEAAPPPVPPVEESAPVSTNTPDRSHTQASPPAWEAISDSSHKPAPGHRSPRKTETARWPLCRQRRSRRAHLRRRVAPDGWAIGLDMTPEMLEVARANATVAGVTNVEFFAGYLGRHPAA